MKKKILIIDDDYHSARFLAKRLRTRNYEVIVTDEGSQGVQIAKERFPDLILLDMIMPRLNGIEVFEELRQLDTTKKIPVIFMAAHPTLEIRNLVLRMGAKEIITKPFLSKDFELTIEMVINNYNIIETNHQHLKNRVEKV
ncbi:PleD family two-component system response regulator [Candidatus Neomarinimicrobiota bacterium]